MNNNRFLKFAMITMVLCIIFTSLCACNSQAKDKYYSKKENYITVTGVVSSIKYNEDSTVLYLEFSELLPVLDDVCFKIVGDNLQIVQDNELDTKLRVGARVDFVTAPKYFGDGYVMPIVAISANGECLLDFEEGYKNLLDWLS